MRTDGDQPVTCRAFGRMLGFAIKYPHLITGEMVNGITQEFIELLVSFTAQINSGV